MKIRISLFLLLFIASYDSSHSRLISSKREIASVNLCKRLTTNILTSSDSSTTSQRPTRFGNLVNSNKTIIIAHGKNSNVAPESSWANMLYSVQNGGSHFGALEVDVRMTKDGRFIISHDPTFHRLVRDYRTPDYKVAEFKKKYPKLAAKHENDWDFFLFDEVESYSLKDIKSDLKIFHPKAGRVTEFISLAELIYSISKKGRLTVPSWASVKSIDLSSPLVYYLDLKNINHLGRRLEGLSNWHWIKNEMTLEELEKYSTEVIKNFSKVIKEGDGYNQLFVAVRHKNVLELFNRIDPKINIMFSPERISRESSAEEFISMMAPCLENKCKLAEVKYLKHVLDPEIRNWADSNKIKLLYNKIVETDPSQFEGKYKDNLKLLVADILALGENIILQTNTVKELADILQ